MSVPIDVVYTWVNNLDPAWRQSYERALRLEGRSAPARDSASSVAARFTDNGELRYSLRSLDRYGTFVRRVFLVVDGSPPDWLRTDSPDLTVVDHREIFPQDYPLPVFNSDQIEAYLWRIPDLSERYVYFNDDVMLAGDCCEADFFDRDGRSVVRMTPDLIYAPLDPRDRVFNTMLRNTERVIKSRLDLRYEPRFDTNKPWVPMILRRVMQKRLSLNPTAHIAQPFRRSIWPKFHEIFGEELRMLASSRFRHGRGFCVNLAYQYFAYREGYARFTFEPREMVLSPKAAISGTLPEPEAVMMDVAKNDVKFLCFNDAPGPRGLNWRDFIDRALGPTFDSPSRWEAVKAG